MRKILTGSDLANPQRGSTYHSKGGVPAARRAPLRNEHAPAILQHLLGYDEAKIAKLMPQGLKSTS